MPLNKTSLIYCVGTLLSTALLLSCDNKTGFGYSNTQSDVTFDILEDLNPPENFKILALGDSYTIGQSVCISCRFPEQLKDSLIVNFDPQDTFSLEIIAQTGWTTTNLISAIATSNPSSDHNLVTLLIGVNNQYQGKPFALYETEFITLVNTAITLADNDPSNLIVVSIPDYAYTPFGQNYNPEHISQQLDAYNLYAKNYCQDNGISYVYITDITRQGMINPELVASDNLHPSGLAYSKFVERILPLAIEKID